MFRVEENFYRFRQMYLEMSSLRLQNCHGEQQPTTLKNQLACRRKRDKIDGDKIQKQLKKRLDRLSTVNRHDDDDDDDDDDEVQR